MGYSGGTTEDPTYADLGDHSESIQIDFDPTLVSFGELLDVFWESHNPATAPSCRQYMSAIFYHDEGQRLLAEQTLAAQEEILGTVHTEIATVKTFYRAEDYHQKWYLRNQSVVMRDFDAIYPDAVDFTDSTAAARVNGIVGRHFDATRIEAELPSFGLSEESNAVLRRMARP